MALAEQEGAAMAVDKTDSLKLGLAAQVIPARKRPPVEARVDPFSFLAA
jgi:hypothetical protein